MRLIRKFVGCIKVAAGVTGVLVLGFSTQTASAATASTETIGAPPVVHETNTTIPAPSPACVAAIQAIKTAFANERSEDAAERAQQALNPDLAADAAEDAAERAHFKALFAAAHAACAETIAAVIKTHQSTTLTQSAACTAAAQALKAELRAIWRQGTRPTSAQWARVRSLGAAARAACGWSWRQH